MAETLLAPRPVEPGRLAMERLDFTLPDFTRWAWVSDQAKRAWEPRLARVASAWAEIEWRAVLAGVRACAVTIATPEEFLTQGARWAEAGLSVLPVEITGVSGQPYSATSVPREPGQPFTFRFVVGRPDDVAAFKRAWDAADQEAIGNQLGYPPCCREFFRRVWVESAMIDTTWPMAVATAAAADGTTTLEVSGPPQANILWRWMGIRAVPHLPCRFDCAATAALADRLIAVGRDAGFEAEMDWLLEILSWSVEWSALHGIAEIKTPVLKVSTRTDATSRRYTVRRHGNTHPSEGPQGLTFPYHAPVKLRLTGTRGFRRGLEHATIPRRPRPGWYATDNGFASITAMRDAHRPIIEAAAAAVADRGGNVVDLGCGNGALLEALTATTPGIVPFGIDLDPARIEHARTLQPRHADHFLAGDLLDDEQLWSRLPRFALAILMPGRLLEAGPHRAARLREQLRARSDQLLVYAYGDWLSHSGGLAELALRTGLALIDPSTQSPAALATVLDPATKEYRHES